MIRVGERFSLPEEDIFGIVDQVIYADCEVIAIVVELDNGKWASVDMRLVAPRVLQ
jgi:hypothetical protein